MKEIKGRPGTRPPPPPPIHFLALVLTICIFNHRRKISTTKKKRDREKSYWGLGWWRVLTDRIVIRSYWKYDTLVYRRRGPRARLVDLLWGHSVRIKAYGLEGRISIRSASKRGGWLSLIIDSHNAIAQFLWINEFPFLLHIKEKAMTIPQMNNNFSYVITNIHLAFWCFSNWITWHVGVGMAGRIGSRIDGRMVMCAG